MPTWKQSPEEAFQNMLVSSLEAATQTCFPCGGTGYAAVQTPELREDPQGQPYYHTAAETCEHCEGSGKRVPDPYSHDVATSLVSGIVPIVYPMLDSHDGDEREYGLRLLKCAYDHMMEHHRRTLEESLQNEEMVERLRFLGERFARRQNGEHPPLSVFEEAKNAPNPPGSPSTGALTPEEIENLLGEQDA